MDTFFLTKKKLLQLCPENQNKHIIIWLSRFYQKLTTNRMHTGSLDLFVLQYNQILLWTGMKVFTRPESNDTRTWIEIISNRIQYHRTASGHSLRDHDLLEKVRTDDLSIAVNHVDIQCHAALDGLRSVFNVGSVFRICEAAGFNSIILGNTLGNEHPAVRKTAMGADKWLEQEKTDDLAQTLIKKKEKKFKIIGVETIKGACPFYDMTWKKKTIVVFGNEEYGISSHVIKTCDEFVYIPMYGKKNSLNVANAVSIICFHMAGSLKNPAAL